MQHANFSTQQFHPTSDLKKTKPGSVQNTNVEASF